MTSSPDIDDLPPALSVDVAARASSATGTSPAMLLAAFVLSLLAALPDALLALWLKLLGDGVLDARPPPRARRRRRPRPLRGRDVVPAAS